MQHRNDEAAQTVRRVIKKYPNRRLYDTDSSSYITLAEVKQLVMDSEPFIVRDAKSGEDLTRNILLQIILEEVGSGSPMFTAPVLASIIRFYGHAMHGFMGGYLEKNMQVLMDFQSRLGDPAAGLTPEMWTQLMSTQFPVFQAMMGGASENPSTLIAQFQEQLQRQTGQMLDAFGIKR